MYKVISKLLIVVQFTILSSCVSGNYNEQVLTYEDLKNKSELLYDLQTLVGQAEYVPLETTDISMIKYIEKVEIDSEHIYVLSESRLLVFNREGEFLYRIGNKGFGPEETASIISFAIDRTDKTIYALDLIRQRISIYDKDGNYIESMPYPEGQPVQIDIQHDVLYLAYLVFMGTENYKLMAIDKRGVVKMKSRNDIKFQGESPFVVSNYKFIQLLGDEMIYRQNFNDTIYTCRYANQSLSTRYLFDFGSMKPPYSILGNSMAFEQKERSYAFIKDVTESPIHIFLYLQVGGKDVRFIKEKKNSKTYLLAENGLSFWPYWYSDGCLIGFYSIQHINGRSIKDGRLKNVVEGMKADSNPILSIIK